MALVELYTEVAALVTYAEHTMLARQLGQHDKPPRYVWVPVSHGFLPPAGPGTKVTISGLSVSGYARVLYNRTQRVEVHCWASGGDDDDPLLAISQAEAMEAALVTGLRTAANANYIPVSSTWGMSRFNDLGIVLTHTFDWIPALRDTIGTTTPPTDPTLNNPLGAAVLSTQVTDISFAFPGS